jgi:multidrug efflux pump subunit AcrA (membrane-fusion protein)
MEENVKTPLGATHETQRLIALPPALPALSLAGSARFTRLFSWFLSLGFLGLIFGIAVLPWRQFVSGSGRVIAFNPLDRRINIEAQVSGRVKHLHVAEGQRVKKGQLLVEIQDNDPNLLKMLTRAISTSRNFAKYIQVQHALICKNSE